MQPLGNPDHLVEEIPGYPGYYIARDGKVYSSITGTFLTECKKNEYRMVHPTVNGKVKKGYIHRLLALTYIPNEDPTKTVVNHKDGNPGNNKLDNLEWCTPSENTQHAIDTGLIKHYARPVCKLDQNGLFVKEFDSIVNAAKDSALNPNQISAVCIGKKFTAGGYRWVYKEEFGNTLRENKREKRVQQIAPTGDVVRVFATASEAANAIGCKIKKMRYACINGRVCGGYTWKYVEKQTEEKPDLYSNWTTIPDHPKYKISREGQVYSLKFNRVLKPQPSDKYLRVTIDGSTYLVHRLVALTYIPNPDRKLYVNHKDGNGSNNSVENLEWCSHEENMQHAYDTGLNKGRNSKI
jgi:hypothetical protein